MFIYSAVIDRSVYLWNSLIPTAYVMLENHQSSGGSLDLMSLVVSNEVILKPYCIMLIS